MHSSNDFCIMTDSAADLSKSMCEELDIGVMPLSVYIDGNVYKDYPDERDITRREFYKLLRDKKFGKTSAVNVSHFYEVFEKVLLKKRNILYIALSSGLSATYSNAQIAAEKLRSLYPDNEILICDSLCASLGQGLLVYFAVRKKDLGYSLCETYDFVEKKKLSICHWFTVEDLHHLQRGGRIPKFVAIAGSLLNVKPILHVDNNGKLIKMYSIRGRNNSVHELFNNLKRSLSSADNQTIFISHGDCEKDAQTLKSIIKNEIKPEKIYINSIGPVIGMHSGPGTLALFFVGNSR